MTHRTANSESEDSAEIYRTVRDVGYSPETSLQWIRYLRKRLERRRREREEATSTTTGGPGACEN